MATQAQTNGTLALEQKNRVIIIPAHDEIVARKLRVAAYARVSSSSEDQLNSYRAQNQYYSELISNNPDWEMVDIYADSGITGTSVDKREDFKRMMADCRKGKIDRILVKSISRFARNTKDCLAAVRELKELGVSVLFEEQGIDTARVSSEMVTAIMASLAQKQSESISGNVKWGVQKRMQDGTFIPSYLPYGYRLVNKQIQINDAEAATPEIEQQVTHLLGRLSEQPERIKQPETAPAIMQTDTQRKLDDVLNAQPLDEDAARSLICKLAQEQYDAIGNEEYETERLRRLFTAFECTAELNADLLQSAVSAVLVTHQMVRLQLKNGQIVGKEDLA